MGRGFSIFKRRGHQSTERSIPNMSSQPNHTFNFNPEPSIYPDSSNKSASWDPPAYQEHQSASTQAGQSQISAGDSDFDFLKDFDTIFLVDDSSSMCGPRWREAEAAIAAIAPICTQHDSDGIDVYFLNHRNTRFTHANRSSTSGAYENVTSAQEVREIFSSVTPRGATAVGGRLRDILKPYMQRVERMQASQNQYGDLSDPSLFVKPVNIITITDGAFTDDTESVLVQVARMLDTSSPQCPPALPWQVGIQFFQIGDDKDASKYLQELDDELGRYCQDGKLRDIVDTVPWRGSTGSTLDAKGILKCVLGSVNKKLDRQRV
ncbi:hypothetical protein N7466_001194 [Penicillium verhagenii]|uniref:uncharacterized protein n=1 Tax=Penicillium verhagenii TaxID=1562060 RepID=UPI0025455BDA|nr:uncharacterized protein N7466_001194 [Penicillium verhagenii]KAJ5948179.1 hypothetical protein N7466_001194 [Penicillium verhagenii]